MVDIHCHLVPGVDDGAATAEVTLAMIEQAASVGVTHIVTTPHIRGRVEDLAIHEQHKKAFATVSGDIRGVDVRLGCEVKVTSEMHLVADRREFTFAQAGKYLLFELPFESVPSYTPQLLFDLKLNGITPIIAHPERIIPILKDPGIAVDLVAQGALLQVTNGCLTGDLGEAFEACSRSLVEHGLVSIMASDAHNVTSRTYLAWPRTVEILAEIEARQTKERGRAAFSADALTTSNPLAAWKGETIEAPDISHWDRDDLKASVRAMASRLPTKKRRFFSFK